MTRQRESVLGGAATKISARSLVIGALVAGTLLRLVFVLGYAHIAGDATVYGEIATNMLRAHTFGLHDGGALHSTLIRLPGYPAFLAVCFAVFGIGNFTAALYVQLFMDLATCVLLALLAQRLGGRRAGLATLWLAALCPFTANYVAAPLTEVPAMLCAACAFFCLERLLRSEELGRIAWPAWAGLAAALLANDLLRPDRGLLTVAIVAALVWPRHGRWPSARQRFAGVLLCAVLALPLLGWGVRNWRVFHQVQPLAPRSAADPGTFVPQHFNRWYRSWAVDFVSTVDTYWTFDGSPLRVDDLPARAMTTPAERRAVAEAYAAYNENTTASPAIDAKFAALADAHVREHRFAYYVGLPVARVANMWLRPRTEMLALPLDWWNFRAHRAGDVLCIAFALVNAAYLWLAAAGLWRWRRTGWSGLRPLGYAMVGFVLLRSALLLTLDNSEPRYTLDCFPVVLLLAGLGFAGRRREQLRQS
jgi:4-amino-4-deoxy-L-arabinose transferase-like glycosyltransferase